MDLKAMGLHIVALRKARGDMSRVDLAREAHVSYTFLQQLESGRGKEPGAKKLAAIAGILGVTVDELLRGPTGPDDTDQMAGDTQTGWSNTRREIEQTLDALSEPELDRVRDLLRVTLRPVAQEPSSPAAKVSGRVSS